MGERSRIKNTNKNVCIAHISYTYIPRTHTHTYNTQTNRHLHRFYLRLVPIPFPHTHYTVITESRNTEIIFYLVDFQCALFIAHIAIIKWIKAPTFFFALYLLFNSLCRQNTIKSKCHFINGDENKTRKGVRGDKEWVRMWINICRPFISLCRWRL